MSWAKSMINLATAPKPKYGGERAGPPVAPKPAIKMGTVEQRIVDWVKTQDGPVCVRWIGAGIDQKPMNLSKAMNSVVKKGLLKTVKDAEARALCDRYGMAAHVRWYSKP
jgi:hypothetical protein